MSDILLNALVEENNRIWGIPIGHSLICIELNTNTVNIIEVKDNFIHEYVNEPILLHNKRIYWTSREGTYLREYSIYENNYRTYELPKVIYREYMAISMMRIIENVLYVLPKYSPFLIIIDTLKNEVKSKDITHRYFIDEDIGIFCSIFYENKIYSIFDKQGVIVEYDLITGVTNEITFNIGKCEIKSAFLRENIIYILTSNSILEFNITLRSFATISINEKNSFDGMLIVTKNKFFIFPHYGEDIYVLDKNGKKIDKFRGYPEDFLYNNIYKWPKYISYYMGEKHIWLNNRCANYGFRINLGTEEIEWYKFPIINDVDYMRLDIDNNIIISEDENCDLKKYIDILAE